MPLTFNFFNETEESFSVSYVAARHGVICGFRVMCH